MRVFAGVLGLAAVLTGCVPTPRVILPASAPIARDIQGPPLEVAEALTEEERAANPFSSDDIVPCKDEDDRATARIALGAVADDMNALGEGSSNAERDKALAKLVALLKTPCFELAARDLPDALEFDSAFSLKTWWYEGGEQAIASYVQNERKVSYFMIPGSPRASLLLTEHPKHPLAPLLCAESDADCGRETAGWIERAEELFRARAQRTAEDDCEKSALSLEPQARWKELLSCKTDKIERTLAFPLGRFRAMNDGWFVVSNPWSSCEQLSMYDLASGTHIRVSSCTTPTQVEIDRVPLATIREAAWMTVFANYIKSVRPVDQHVVPSNVVPGRTREESGTLQGTLQYSSSRGRRSIWTWYRPQNGKLVGQVTGMIWGAPESDASHYAWDLYRLAENAAVKGCAPAFSAATLASFVWDKPGPYVREDSELQPFDPFAPPLVAARGALAQAKAPSRCTVPM